MMGLLVMQIKNLPHDMISVREDTRVGHTQVRVTLEQVWFDLDTPSFRFPQAEKNSQAVHAGCADSTVWPEDEPLYWLAA